MHTGLCLGTTEEERCIQGCGGGQLRERGAYRVLVRGQLRDRDELEDIGVRE